MFSLRIQLLDFHFQYSDGHEEIALFTLTLYQLNMVEIIKGAYVYTWKANSMPRILLKQAHLAGNLSTPDQPGEIPMGLL